MCQTNLQLVWGKVLDPEFHSHMAPSPPEGLHRDPPLRRAAQLIPLPKSPRIKEWSSRRRLNLVGGLFSAWRDLQEPGSSAHSLTRAAGGPSTGTGDDCRMRKYTGRGGARALHYPRSSRDWGTTIPRMLCTAGRPILSQRLQPEASATTGPPFHAGQEGRILVKLKKNPKSQPEIIFR